MRGGWWRCLNCDRSIQSMGVAGHRAMHRRRKELVTMRGNGIEYTWDYRERPEGRS